MKYAAHAASLSRTTGRHRLPADAGRGPTATLAAGKAVLFVSEKTAALEVVKRRRPVRKNVLRARTANSWWAVRFFRPRAEVYAGRGAWSPGLGASYPG